MQKQPVFNLAIVSQRRIVADVYGMGASLNSSCAHTRVQMLVAAREAGHNHSILIANCKLFLICMGDSKYASNSAIWYKPPLTTKIIPSPKKTFYKCCRAFLWWHPLNMTQGFLVQWQRTDDVVMVTLSFASTFSGYKMRHRRYVLAHVTRIPHTICPTHDIVMTPQYLHSAANC